MAASATSASASLPPGMARPAGDSVTRLIAGTLFLLGVAIRLPFRSQVLYHWDSVSFALATVRFDVAEGQPHVPGYILYVALGWLGNVLTHDPQVTFVGLSVLFSGLSASALFYLGSAMFDRRTGLVAGLLLLASPLFWFYGEVALPHVVDTFSVVLLALLLYRSWQGQEGYLLAAAPAVAIAGGIRPQTVAFLGALCLLAACRARARTVVVAAGIAATLSALWLVPLVWLTGGLARYQEAASSFSQAFHYWEPSHGLLRGDPSAFLISGARLVSYTGYAVGLAALPLAVYALRTRRAFRALVADPRTCFFVAWIGPAVLFYLFVHMGQPGLVLVFLPALLLLAAASAAGVLSGRRVGRLDLLTAGTALAVALHAGIFLAAPERLPGPGRPKILTWSAIRNLDQRYLALMATIQAEFPPDRTVLVGANWRHVGYYLPEHCLVRLPTVGTDGARVASMGAGDVDRPISARAGGLPLPPGDGLTVVLVDGDPRQVPRDVPARLVPMPSGPPLYVLSLGSDLELWWANGRLHTRHTW